MTATRLLVLGVVRGYGRAHGYLVQNALLSWGAANWANIKWGSIYHALKQLTRQGYLTATEVWEAPGRVDYEVTEAAEGEFLKLLRDAIRRPDNNPDLLGAGLVFLPALPRAEAVALLTERLAALETTRDSETKQAAQAGAGTVPDHIRELHGLWAYNAGGAAEWTRELIRRLEGGAYQMAGEGGPDGREFGAPGAWANPTAPGTQRPPCPPPLGD
jgi:DNA-binding PadR family transcriptional regulator